LYNFLSYAHLSLSFHAFVSSVDSYLIPKLIRGLVPPGWLESMKGITNLENNGNLMPLPNGKKAVGCY